MKHLIVATVVAAAVVLSLALAPANVPSPVQAPAGTAAAPARDIFAVRAYGATGDGRTDDTASINKAIADASFVGGTVWFAPGTYKVTSSLIVSAKVKRPVILAGSRGVDIKGSGFPLLSIGRSGTIVRDLNIVDSNPTGAHGTIGIDINNGKLGVNNWELQNVWILGQNSNGDGGLAKLVKDGTGIQCVFALKGKIDGCVIEGWNAGIVLQRTSNANAIVATKIRVNSKGIDIPAGGADDVFFTGNTIEANSIGISCDGAALLNICGNHFENNLGERVNIRLSAGWLASTGNFYAGANPNMDIQILGGTYKSASRSDVLNSGTTHNGAGPLYLEKVAFPAKSTGTGKTLLDASEVPASRQ